MTISPIHTMDEVSRPLLSVDQQQEAKNGSGSSRTFLQQLHHHYHVSQEILLRKLFQISPWKGITMRQYAPLFYRSLQEERVETENQTRRWWSWLSVSLLFPVKLFCHLLLIVFLALILSYNNDLYATYHRAAQTISCRFFLPVDYCNYEDCVGSLSRQSPSVNSFTCAIYQQDVMTDVLLRSIEEYLHINETSLANFQLPATLQQANNLLENSPNLDCVGDNNHQSPTITVYYKRNSGKTTYDLYHNFQDNEMLISSILQASNRSSIQALSLSFPLYDSLAFDRYGARYTWLFSVLYTYKSQVNFDVEVKAEVIQICSIQKTISKALWEDQDDNEEGDATSLSSKQYVIYALSICAIVCSTAYAMLLFREAVDNFRLLAYASDVLSKNHGNTSREAESILRTFVSKATDFLRMMLGVPILFSPENPRTLLSQESLASQAPKALYGQDEDRQRVGDWEEHSVKVKMRILDGWRMLSFFASLLSLYACCVLVQVSSGFYCTIFIRDQQYEDHDIGSTSTSVEYHTDSYPKHNLILILGLSLAFHCISTLHYLRYNNRFTTSTLILWGAFFKVQRILFSALPLVIGLLLLGLLVFGNSAQNFGSAPSIFVTLYAVMNCDSIYDTFIATNSTENIGIIGTIYVTVIFILFNYLMLRLVLAVVESLYFSLRLYSSSRKKRIVYRKKLLANLLDDADRHLQGADNTADSKGQTVAPSERRIKVRTHGSDDIQRSLLHMYSLYLKDQTSSPS